MCAPPASTCIFPIAVSAYVFAPAINESTPSALYTTAELVSITPTLPSVSLMFFNVTLFDASAADTFPALVTSNALTADVAAPFSSYHLSTVVLSIEIVPEEVIGPPDKPVPVATEVTVPLGSSPDGITTQADPLEMIISPILHVGHLSLVPLLV